MEDYEILTRLGGGTFADVYKAIEKSTNEIVAIKTLKKKYKKWEDCLELRECKSLQKLQDDSLSTEKGFEYIVKLKRILFIKKTNTLNLIFEYMDKDLLEQMKFLEPKTLTEQQIKNFIYQILLGLSHMHKYGFFHRDMKPENILIKNNNLAKIADFGLAREIRSLPPYTEYVSTRYYRAPECLLKFNNYNSPIDIWALGCIMAEMYLHPQPLFYGINEKEVLFKICFILGSPNYENWSDGVQQANILGIKLPNNSGVNLENVIKNASNKSIDLMKQMLQWDPNKRPNANSLLNHCFFDDCKNLKNSKDENITINISKIVEDIEKNKNFINNNESSLIQKEYNVVNTSTLNLKNSGCYDNNNISKILNDTDGFDNLLNQLKKEKSEEDREFYEKNEKDKSKCCYFNDFDISNIIVNGLDNTNFSINKSNTLFNQSLKINPNKSNNVVDTEFSYIVSNGNVNQLNEINEDIKEEKKSEEILENNNINKNEKIISSNKENNKPEENDFDFNDQQLKKTQKTSRIRSARKFLEETENNFNCEKSKRLSYYGKGFFNPNNKDGNIKYNYNENNSEKNINNKLNKNDFMNKNEELNRMFDLSRKKLGIIENDFIKKDFNFLNNNINPMNQKINNKETMFRIGGRRNYLPNNNAIWGI